MKEGIQKSLYKKWLLDMNEEEFEANRQHILTLDKDGNAIKALLEVMRIKIERRINKLNKL
jgi:glutamine synthetase adenylyltransferase